MFFASGLTVKILSFNHQFILFSEEIQVVVIIKGSTKKLLQSCPEGWQRVPIPRTDPQQADLYQKCRHKMLVTICQLL